MKDLMPGGEGYFNGDCKSIVQPYVPDISTFSVGTTILSFTQSPFGQVLQGEEIRVLAASVGLGSYSELLNA